jgi:rhamnose transport system permease protein
VAIFVAVGIGAGLGIVNGVLVAVARVPTIIVTLGTLSIFRSVLTSHAGGKTVATGSLPTWLVDLPRSTVVTVGGYEVRTMFALALIIVILLHLTLQYTRGGRHLYALGSNPDAARQAGLDGRRIQIAAFVACGALAGLAGFLYVGRFGTINVTAGSGLELAAIAAAVVGGVSTLGGSGTIMGALLGAVLIGLLDQSLVRVDQISEFWRDAILGALILFAVLLDVTVGRRLRASARNSVTVDAGGDSRG